MMNTANNDTTAAFGQRHPEAGRTKRRGCRGLRWLILGMGCSLPWLADAAGPQRPGRVVEVGRKPELFLHDDYLIKERQGVTLVPGKVEKYSKNPVLKLDKPWEAGYYMTGCSVLHDVEEKVYKMWYDVRNTKVTDPDLPYGQIGHCAYATSKDGLNWTKPILNVINWKGSTENNVVFVGPNGKRTKGYSVMKDYSDPDPARRYKMLFHFWDFRGRGVSIATSPDGINWTSNPYNNLHGGFDTLNVMLLDDRIGAFTAYLRNWVGGRRQVARAVSHDGVHWSKPITVLGPDDRDPPTVDIYAGSVIKPRDPVDTYVMLAVAYNRKDDTSHSQLALSRDGSEWHRIRSPFLPLGGSGEWDRGLTWGIAADVTIGDQTAFYYRGNISAHGSSKNPEAITGVGVAFMRKLGYAGWRAEASGVITTQPILVSHARNSFHINADAESGSIEVELLNREGKIIPGFSRKDCEPIRASGIKLPVKWKGEAGLRGHLLAGPMQLRIYLQGATIYGLGCAERPIEE
jgi:hypothetical protein